MKFTIQFDTNNDSFKENEADEIASVLEQIAKKVRQGNYNNYHKNIHDSNGNVIGTYVHRK